MVFAAVNLNPSLTLAAEWESLDHRPPSLAMSVSFHYCKHLLAQVGYISATGMPFIGMGFRWRSILLTVGASAHPALGYRSGSTIEYMRTPTTAP